MNYAPAAVAARPRTRTLGARFDVVLVGCSVLLGMIGVVTVYTATKGKLALLGEDPRYFLKRQAVFLVIGVVVMVVMAVFDYRRLEQIS
ncbi:MAG TPA: FtsW/RodA/SpoVE family cell cycle protein, partial [Acidimicrobiales bacterium]